MIPAGNMDLYKEIKNIKNGNYKVNVWLLPLYFSVEDDDLNKNSKLHYGIYNICVSKMHDNTSIKTRRGEMELYHHKVSGIILSIPKEWVGVSTKSQE